MCGQRPLRNTDGRQFHCCMTTPIRPEGESQNRPLDLHTSRQRRQIKAHHFPLDLQGLRILCVRGVPECGRHKTLLSLGRRTSCNTRSSNEPKSQDQSGTAALGFSGYATVCRAVRMSAKRSYRPKPKRNLSHFELRLRHAGTRPVVDTSQTRVVMENQVPTSRRTCSLPPSSRPSFLADDLQISTQWMQVTKSLGAS